MAKLFSGLWLESKKAHSTVGATTVVGFALGRLDYEWGAVKAGTLPQTTCDISSRLIVLETDTDAAPTKTYRTSHYRQRDSHSSM